MRLSRLGAQQLGHCPDFRAAKMGLSSSEIGKPFCYRSLLTPLCVLLVAIGSPALGDTITVAPPDAEVPVKPYDVFSRELTIRGSYTNPYVMNRALSLLAAGRLDWEEIVTHRFPMDDFDDAWAAHREGAGLKISVQPAAPS